MGEQYFKGVLAGYLGANFMCGPITEWQIDNTKAEVGGVKNEMRGKGMMMTMIQHDRFMGYTRDLMKG